MNLYRASSNTSTNMHPRSILCSPAVLLSSTSVFLVALLVAFLSGSVFLGADSSFADEYAEVEIQVEIQPVLSLTTDATQGVVSIPIMPSPTGTLSSSNLSVDVSTNNITGYTLTMEALYTPVDPEVDPLGTALVHTILSDDYSILSTTTPIDTPTTLPINTWGYSNWTDTQISTATAPTTFYRIPQNGSPDTIRTTREPALSSESKLTFAAFIDSSTASGTYSNTMLFSAVSNEPPVMDYGLLQHFHNGLCTTTRGTATDGRNGQVVFVRSIPGVTADEGTGGRGGDLCWMETNLRYAGDGVNGYEHEGGIWHDDRYATSSINDTTINHFDDVRPLTQVSSGSTTPLAYDQAQYVDPGGAYPLNALSNADYTAYYNNSEYYGYLYNWCAAMGGVDEACQNTEATQPPLYSICPFGWRLPSSTELSRLIGAINATNDPFAMNVFGLATYSGSYSSGLSGQGTFGSIWTNSMAGATDAYNMNLTNATISASSVSYKNTAYAIRCVREDNPEN